MNEKNTETQPVASGKGMTLPKLAGLILVLGVILVGWLVIYPAMQPTPLAEKHPEVAVTLQEGITHVAAVVEDGQAALSNVLGGNPTSSKADTTTSGTDTTKTGDDAGEGDTRSAGQMAWEDTWLTPADPAVFATRSAITDCERLTSDAEALLDPTRTLVHGLWGHENPDVTPRLISVATAESLADELTGCVTPVEEGITTVHTNLDKAKTTASDTAALDENTTAATALDQAITTARSVLDATAGKVTDETTRTLLATVIDTATTTADTSPPATGWEAIDAHTQSLRDAQATLDAPQTAVSGSHTTWQDAENARIAAEQAAAAEAANTYDYGYDYDYSGGGGGSTPPAGSNVIGINGCVVFGCDGPYVPPPEGTVMI